LFNYNIKKCKAKKNADAEDFMLDSRKVATPIFSGKLSVIIDEE